MRQAIDAFTTQLRRRCKPEENCRCQPSAFSHSSLRVSSSKAIREKKMEKKRTKTTSTKFNVCCVSHNDNNNNNKNDTQNKTQNFSRLRSKACLSLCHLLFVITQRTKATSCIMKLRVSIIFFSPLHPFYNKKLSFIKAKIAEARKINIHSHIVFITSVFLVCGNTLP